MNMYTKILYFIIICILPIVVTAQSPRESLEDLLSKAKYADGTRQSNAQNALGIRYENGTYGANINYKEAFYWYKQSANNGNKYAMYNLATCYFYGRGVDVNFKEGISWIEKSARNYLPAATLLLGKWYYFGQYKSQDYFKAARLFKDSAFGGNAEAMYFLAWCNAFGQGVKTDSIKSNFWVWRAIERDCFEGYNLLGIMYRDGMSVQKNFENALFYFKEGANLNVSSCFKSLGDMYLNGQGVLKDTEEAIEYYNKAANLNDVDAMEQLFSIFYYKDYDKESPEKALYYGKKCFEINKNIDIAYMTLGICHELKDYNTALSICNDPSLTNDKVALNQLAYLHAEGHGVKKDIKKALNLIEKAILIDPDDANLLDSKGEILLKDGKIRKARDVWETLLKKFPTFYSDYYKRVGVKSVLNEYMLNNPN